MENENPKKFTLIVTCYTEPLSTIENINEQEMLAYIENYHESLPKNEIKEALLNLKIGEVMDDRDWHINNSKLLGMSPKYHREIKLIRIS